MSTVLWSHKYNERTLSFSVHGHVYATKMDFSDVSDGEMISTTQLEDEIECCDVADEEELIMASNNFACNVTASVFTLTDACVVSLTF